MRTSVGLMSTLGSHHSDGSAPPLPAMGDGSPVGGRTLDMDALRSGADADSDADSDAADDGRRVRTRLTQI